ncbi:Integral membrane protein [Chitinispirillum alkaliphilum]|nr:Integral membrane protein [Chitinispirillum alkaliphilum]
MDYEKKAEERQRYRELLEELRTIIPGAQVLFAFLLTAPFAARFHLVDFWGQLVFTISLLSVAAATILFLAPAAYHRLAGRRDRKGRLSFGVKSTLVGLLLLGLSISCAVFVIIRFMFNNTLLGVVFAITSGVMAFLLWYVHPLLNRKRTRDKSESQT